MAQKTHPIALRLGIKQFWFSSYKNPWLKFSGFNIKNLFFKDLLIRKIIVGFFKSFNFITSEPIVHLKPTLSLENHFKRGVTVSDLLRAEGKGSQKNPYMVGINEGLLSNYSKIPRIAGSFVNSSCIPFSPAFRNTTAFSKLPRVYSIYTVSLLVYKTPSKNFNTSKRETSFLQNSYGFSSDEVSRVAGSVGRSSAESVKKTVNVSKKNPFGNTLGMGPFLESRLTAKGIGYHTLKNIKPSLKMDEYFYYPYDSFDFWEEEGSLTSSQKTQIFTRIYKNLTRELNSYKHSMGDRITNIWYTAKRDPSNKRSHRPLSIGEGLINAEDSLRGSTEIKTSEFTHELTGNNQYKHTLSEAQKNKGYFCLTGGELVVFYSGKYATPRPSVNNKDARSSSGRSLSITEEDEETLKMIENKHEVGLSSMDDKNTVDDEYLTTSQKISEADPCAPLRGASQPSWEGVKNSLNVHDVKSNTSADAEVFDLASYTFKFSIPQGGWQNCLSHGPLSFAEGPRSAGDPLRGSRSGGKAFNSIEYPLSGNIQYPRSGSLWYKRGLQNNGRFFAKGIRYADLTEIPGAEYPVSLRYTPGSATPQGLGDDKFNKTFFSLKKKRLLLNFFKNLIFYQRSTSSAWLSPSAIHRGLWDTKTDGQMVPARSGGEPHDSRDIPLKRDTLSGSLREKRPTAFMEDYLKTPWSGKNWNESFLSLAEWSKTGNDLWRDGAFSGLITSPYLLIHFILENKNMEIPQGSATRIFRKEAYRWHNFREADAFSVKNRFLYRDPSRVSKIKHSSDTIKGHKINFKRLTKGIPMDDSEDILGSNGSPKDPALRGIFFRSYRNLSFKEVKNFYEYNSFLSFQILFWYFLRFDWFNTLDLYNDTTYSGRVDTVGEDVSKTEVSATEGLSKNDNSVSWHTLEKKNLKKHLTLVNNYFLHLNKILFPIERFTAPIAKTESESLDKNGVNDSQSLPLKEDVLFYPIMGGSVRQRKRSTKRIPVGLSATFSVYRKKLNKYLFSIIYNLYRYNILKYYTIGIFKDLETKSNLDLFKKTSRSEALQKQLFSVEHYYRGEPSQASREQKNYTSFNENIPRNAGSFGQQSNHQTKWAEAEYQVRETSASVRLDSSDRVGRTSEKWGEEKQILSEKSQLNKILSDLKKMSKELSILKYSKFLGRDAVSFGKKIDLSLNKIVQEFNKINDLKNSNITRKKFFIFKSKLFHPFKVYQNYLYHRSNKDQPSVVKQSNKVEPDSAKINAPLCGVLSPAPRGLSLHFSGVTPLSAKLRDPAKRGTLSEPAKLRGEKSKAKDINSLVYTSWDAKTEGESVYPNDVGGDLKKNPWKMSLLDPLRVSSLHFSGVTPLSAMLRDLAQRGTKSESDWPSPLAIQRSLWDNSDILTFKVFSYLIYFFKTINLITQQNKASQIGRPLFLLQMRGSPLGGASNAEIGENKARWVGFNDVEKKASSFFSEPIEGKNKSFNGPQSREAYHGRLNKSEPLSGTPAERDPSLHLSGVTPPAKRGTSWEPAMLKGLQGLRHNKNNLKMQGSFCLSDSKISSNIWVLATIYSLLNDYTFSYSTSVELCWAFHEAQHSGVSKQGRVAQHSGELLRSWRKSNPIGFCFADLMKLDRTFYGRKNWIKFNSRINHLFLELKANDLQSGFYPRPLSNAEGPRSAGGVLFGSRPRGAEISFVEENISEVGLLNKQSKPLSGLFELLNITDFHSELPKDVASRHKNPNKEGTNIESSLLNTKKNSIITYQYIISKNFFNFVSNLYIYNLTNSEKFLNSLCGYSVLPSFEEFSKGVNKPRLRKYSNTERIAASQLLYGSPWDGILIFNFLYRSALFNGRQSEVHLGWLQESRKYSTKVERGKSTTPFFLAPFSRTQLSNFRENVNKTTYMGKENIRSADPHGNREIHVTDPYGVTTSKEVNSDSRYSSLGRAGSITPSERGDIPLSNAERPRSAGDLVGDSLVEREKISGFTETYGNLKIRNILPLRSKSFFIHQIYKNILICGLTSFNKINFTGPSSPSMQGDNISTADLVSMETKLFNLAIRGAPIISQQTEAKNRIEGLKILTWKTLNNIIINSFFFKYVSFFYEVCRNTANNETSSYSYRDPRSGSNAPHSGKNLQWLRQSLSHSPKTELYPCSVSLSEKGWTQLSLGNKQYNQKFWLILNFIFFYIEEKYNMEPRNGTLWSCQAGLNPYKEGRRDIYNVKVKGKGISLGLSAPLNKVQIKLSGEESRYPGENLFKEIYPDEALKQESSNIHGYKKHQKLLHFVSTSMNNKTNLSKESSLLNKKILKISLSQKYAA